MSNLAIFDKAQLPSHVASFLNEESNIAEKVTVPSLSPEGKQWTISLNGQRQVMTGRNEDGDVTPIQVFRGVILDYNKRRGRAYYEGTYDPKNPGAPLCWSEDGVTPSASVKEPCAAKCAECPMAVKGSRVNAQGHAVAACSQHKLVAVVPANDLAFQPLRLKLAITSIYDAKSPDLVAKGWYAFDNYTDLLRSRGVSHTAALVTKMTFDPNVPYPKVIFSPDRWLTDAEMDRIKPVVTSDEVRKLVSGAWTPDGVDGVKAAPAAIAAPAAAPAPAPKPSSDPLLVDDEDAPFADPAPAKPKRAAAKKAAPIEVVSEPVVEVVSDDEIPDEVKALMGEWG